MTDSDVSLVSIRAAGEVYILNIGETVHQLPREQFRALSGKVLDVLQVEVLRPHLKPHAAS